MELPGNFTTHEVKFIKLFLTQTKCDATLLQPQRGGIIRVKRMGRCLRIWLFDQKYTGEININFFFPSCVTEVSLCSCCKFMLVVILCSFGNCGPTSFNQIFSLQGNKKTRLPPAECDCNQSSWHKISLGRNFLSTFSKINLLYRML